MQGLYGGECLEFARKLLGLGPMGIGHAKNLPVNFPYPIPGASLAKIRYNNGEYHTVAVTGRAGDAFIYTGSNKDGDGKVEVGVTMKLDDPRLLGFYVPGLSLADARTVSGSTASRP
jgi:hypothetical protein